MHSSHIVVMIHISVIMHVLLCLILPVDGWDEPNHVRESNIIIIEYKFDFKLVSLDFYKSK